MTTTKPFIYLATLRRTGSKLLSGTLSHTPVARIFRELGLPRGNLRFGETERELIESFGLDVDDMHRRLESAEKRERVYVFRDEIYPQLTRHITQIGTKEIRNRRCERLLDAFPEARVIVNARDPRDIFLSLHSKSKNRGRVTASNLANPDNLIEYIRTEFAHQRTLVDSFNAMTVRYEDICVNPALLNQIFEFVDSDVPRVRNEAFAEAARQFAADPSTIQRPGDINEKFETRINTSACGRWTTVTDDGVRNACDYVYDSLPEFVEFWKYDRNEAVATPDTDSAATTVEILGSGQNRTTSDAR